MAIYEWECEECKSHWDTLQKPSDPPPAVCPSCGHEAIRKVITASHKLYFGPNRLLKERMK
jgi:putative FmdB family regulatory protein